DLCSFYGVSLSDAAKALCKQAIKEKILPVKCPKSRTPNAETLAAIAEGEKMLKDPDKYARYYTDEEIKQGLYRK
ncbi:MAG: type II toxin-antitoxin system RelB/DinJ family antitoxin, partial [Candidatus Cloacimonetes bacterium]|nr:type II toxin-antitoxin system RelB/DinJ family antitoxin [Candidatus Cloacimonadota bacterium]